MGKAFVRRLAAIILSLCAVVSLSGCGPDAPSLPKPAPSRIGLRDESGAMRVTFYPSLRKLAKDSQAIVAGMVTDRKKVVETDGVTPFSTLQTVRVLSTLKGSVRPGGAVGVLQDGLPDAGTTGSAAILRKHEVVLLFLDHIGKSDLPRRFEKDYAVKGVTAGIYMLSDTDQFPTLAASGGEDGKAGDVRFSRFMITDGDTLPMTVSLGQVRKAAK